MVDKAKVLAGLEQCQEWNGHCCKCPYHADTIDISVCTANLCKDALELLKYQPETKRVGGSIMTTSETEKVYPVVCKAIVDSLIKNCILLVDKTLHPNGATFTWSLEGVKHDA